MKKASLFLILLAILTGCNQNQNAEGVYDRDEDSNARTFVQNSHSLDSPIGRADQRMSEQNPNLVPVDETRSRSNQKSDIDQARKTIETMNGFVPGSVWINGGRMRVTAYTKGNLSDEEERAAEKRLNNALVHALPRYKIDVHVEGKQR
ncbi:hypothetical protein [Bacillus massilinigeriensis]|uniref:hypothetical protein n=1 Tax=Bacillus massilionigeriensis TaxID=1805475 RepID=UPI00096AFA1E|nr:hypothetical protein [Bacillus massilionigeriensis]